MPRQRFAVAFLQKFGGSKVKRDKGGMPDEPGHRQKLRQAKSLPQLTRCYEFEIELPIVCRREGKKDTAILFRVYEKCYEAYTEVRDKKDTAKLFG